MMIYKSIKDIITKNLKYGFYFKKELELINEYAQLSNSEILEIKNSRFINQYRDVITNCKFYRDFYESKGLNVRSIKSLDDSKILPIITKDIIRKGGESILMRPKFTLMKSHTSGTTGAPLHFYRNFTSVAREYAYIYYYQNLLGYELGDPVVSLKGDLVKGQLYRYDKFMNTLHLSSYELSSDNVNKFYNLIKDFSPKVITGYPSSIHILAYEFYLQNLNLNIPLAFTSSERLHVFQKELIIKVFNSQILDWYGNSERTVALVSSTDGSYFEPPLYSFVEYNKQGIISTSFINDSFPLIRYQVNDLLDYEYVDKYKVKVREIIGRDNEYVVLKCGQKIGLLDHAFNFPNVRNIIGAQIVQSVPGEFCLNIIPDKNFTDCDKNELLKNLLDLLGVDFKIIVKLITECGLILSSTGKYSLVVSYIANTRTC